MKHGPDGGVPRPPLSTEANPSTHSFYKTDTMPLSDLSRTGILWLINKQVFHPRGLALAIHPATGEWQLWCDNEPWSFTSKDDVSKFQAIEDFIAWVKEEAAKG